MFVFWGPIPPTRIGFSGSCSPPPLGTRVVSSCEAEGVKRWPTSRRRFTPGFTFRPPALKRDTPAVGTQLLMAGLRHHTSSWNARRGHLYAAHKGREKSPDALWALAWVVSGNGTKQQSVPQQLAALCCELVHTDRTAQWCQRVSGY